MASLVGPIALPCGTCQVGAGAACVGLGKRGKFHTARRKAALELARRKHGGRRPARDRVRQAKGSRYISRQEAAAMRNRLDDLGFASYDAYRMSSHWLGFRQSWRQTPGCLRVCWVCGDPRYNLHHTDYRRLGRENFDDVVPLCAGHHAEVHRIHVERGVSLARAHGVVRAAIDPASLHPSTAANLAVFGGHGDHVAQ